MAPPKCPSGYNSLTVVLPGLISGIDRINVDRESIAEEELEYEYLRSLCDLSISYLRVAEKTGMEFPAISETVGYLENLIGRLTGGFGELESCSE